MATYRKDIDGLRAIAVLAVVAFHFGWLPCGYLGVDVFFVISGYLITGIIYQQTVEKTFSVVQFYLRRIRRIIPLILLVSFVALVAGMLFMLPDDLENLSESVIATNIFGNNILQLVTTRNYWDVVNEFKPLMHTWSLGVEEQYYLLYPLLFLVMGRLQKKWVVFVLLSATIISVALFFMPSFSLATRYYLLPFRFFELSAGGLAAILFQGREMGGKYGPLLLVALIAVIVLPIKQASNNIEILLAVMASVCLLITGAEKNKAVALLLENKLITGIGKISFSLYMWHQVVLAFTRYFIVQETTVGCLALVFLATLVLSIASWYFIEQPFRDNKRIKTATVLWVVGILFVITTGVATVVYMRAGVLRDVPELGITIQRVTSNMHGRYNAAVKKYDRPFTQSGKIKVLVIGNSFARDWANVLLESTFSSNMELSYINYLSNKPGYLQRLQQADRIFFVEIEKNVLVGAFAEYNIYTSKVWCVGVKNFGVSNGIFYNHKHDDSYCGQTAKLSKALLAKNKLLKAEWGDKYIDLVSRYADSAGTFNVFTPDCKFISQDCRHLTRAGAIYFAHLLNPR